MPSVVQGKRFGVPLRSTVFGANGCHPRLTPPPRPLRAVGSVAVAIEHFTWTAHAQLRLAQRLLDRLEVEQAIREGHDAREVNDGRAQWLVRGETAAGPGFEVIYDHPHGDDVETVRIVSVWRVDQTGR